MEWQAERAAFERMTATLERRYHGRYVAIRGGRVVASDTDHERLYQRTWRKLKGRTFFIGRVGGPDEIVDMPGFDIR